MTEILLIGENKTLLSSTTDLLEQHGECKHQVVHSGDAAFEVLQKESLKLVIIDEKVEGEKGIELAETIVSRNPMLNLAIISDLPADDFHEATEGLGIMAQLPAEPSLEDVQLLLKKLREILAMVR